MQPNPGTELVAEVVPPPPPVPARMPLVASADVALFDTAQFEHMQRVAVLMARTSLIPASLRDDDDARTVANCFLVVNQARRWRMDPFAVAQCCSVVHGRLMYEGKLVAAVLEATLGIRLTYDIGSEKGDQLSIVVSGTLPGETKVRSIKGTVAGWHRGAKSPWADPSAWPRQLRYMGSREWARAHAPAAMLGVIAIEEADDSYAPRMPARAASVPLADIPAAPTKTLPPPAAEDDDVFPGDRDELIPDGDAYVDHLTEELSLCESRETFDEVMEFASQDISVRLRQPFKRRAEAAVASTKRRLGLD